MEINDWNTNPTCRPRIRARPSSSSCVKSLPAISTRPVLGESSPASSASNVDLPAPDAPTMASVSPVRTLKLTSARIVSNPSGLDTVLDTFLASRTTSSWHRERL